MKKEIFRKTSLERLSSPEQLDQLMSVTTPKAWFALMAIATVLVASISWGVLGSIPSKTYGQGILIRSGGVQNITHGSSGKISDVRVKQGDLIKQGDIVARMENHKLVEEILALKKQLQEMEKVQAKLSDFSEAEFQSELYELYELSRRIEDAEATMKIHEANYNKQKAAANVTSIELQSYMNLLEKAKINVATARDNVERLDLLYKGGAVSKTELESAQRAFALEELELVSAEQRVQALPVKEKEIIEELKTQKSQLDQSIINIKLLNEELKDREKKLSTTNASKIIDTKKQMDTLQKELDFSSNIVAQSSGRILEVKVNKGDIIQPGISLFSFVEEGGTINSLEVVVYVPGGEGKKIFPGMEAQISPTIVKKEEFGYMLGRVISVSEYPATTQGMMLTLGNEELVAQLSGKNAPIEVRIELILDASTLSGYKWSTPQGPPMEIDSGTLCSASITVSRQKPIRMVIPKIKQYLPFY
ncbi:MAG: NHLP bacteriocin system secretion protein [Thermotaleaceae bacterium]